MKSGDGRRVGIGLYTCRIGLHQPLSDHQVTEKREEMQGKGKERYGDDVTDRVSVYCHLSALSLARMRRCGS